MKDKIIHIYKKITSSKIAMSLIIIIVILTVIVQYTSFVANKFNNNTPANAIRAYNYNEYEDIFGKMAAWKFLLVEVEEVEEPQEPRYDSTPIYGNEVYYKIVRKGIHTTLQSHMGGIWKLRKIDNRYYVVEYLGYG